MKRILIFSDEFPGAGGGAGVVAKQLAIALQAQGNRVSVLTRTHKSLEYLSNCEMKVILPIPKIWPLLYVWWLWFGPCNWRKFDRILLNDTAAAFAGGLCLPKQALKKSIMMLHGSEPERIFEKPSMLKKIFFFRQIYSRVLRNCEMIIAVSRYMKEKFTIRTPHKDLAGKIKVAYCGVDKNLFFYEENFPKTNLSPFFEGKKLILSVSRIERDKGYLAKLDVFKNISAMTDGAWHWLVIGDGPFKAEFEKLVDREGLSANIHFLGRVPRHELKSFYSRADLFWLLSDYDESFGLVYLEAQACGCPVIGWARAGVREAVKHLKTGFLVQNKEDVANIILSEAYSQLDREDILRFAKSFSHQSLLDVLNS